MSEQQLLQDPKESHNYKSLGNKEDDIHMQQPAAGGDNKDQENCTIDKNWCVNFPWFFFILVQFVAGMIKYGPIHQTIKHKNGDCQYYFEFDMHTSCWIFKFTIFQCIVYVLVFLVPL